jgi:hypothetical protein
VESNLGQTHHRNRLSKATTAMDASACTGLTSRDFDDRLLAALDAIDSPSDASRVLGMLYDEPGLLKAFKAMDRIPRVVQPASDIITVAQRRAPEVA